MLWVARFLMHLMILLVLILHHSLNILRLRDLLLGILIHLLRYQWYLWLCTWLLVLHRIRHQKWGLAWIRHLLILWQSMVYRGINGTNLLICLLRNGRIILVLLVWYLILKWRKLLLPLITTWLIHKTAMRMSTLNDCWISICPLTSTVAFEIIFIICIFTVSLRSYLTFG